VWSPREQSRAQFIDDMSPRVGIPITEARSAEAAVAGADLVVLATASKTPVVESQWIADGAHVMCVGACRPDQREMAPALVERARLYVDSRAAALVESGDVVMNIAEGRFDKTHVRGELGELVLGRVPGRASAADVTIFKSLGMAVEDVVAADLVFRRASEGGAGTELTL
jgi:alanine dehydrogenase